MDWVRLFNRMFDRAPVTADTYVVVLEQDYVNKFTAWINNLDTANKTRSVGARFFFFFFIFFLTRLWWW